MILDLIVASSALWRSLAFTVSAIFTLTLGIGVKATMFSVVNSDFLLPARHQANQFVLGLEKGRNRILVQCAMRGLRIKFREDEPK
jgi:hypothetical protein